MPIYYLLGASNYLRETSQPGFPVKNDIVSGRLFFNELLGGAWQLTAVNNNDYVLAHIFATNDSTRPYVSFMGQSQYATAANARTAAGAEIANIITILPRAELIPIATVIFQTSNTFNNAVKARVIEVSTGVSYVDWRKSDIVASGAATPTDHNSLSGKQGGTTGEYYHLTAAEYSGLISEAEVASISGNLQMQIDGKIGVANISGGASTIVSNNLTSSRALVSNASGKVATSSVTSTQLGYVAGATSNIQTQINSEVAARISGDNAILITVADISAGLSARIDAISGGTIDESNLVHKTGDETISGIKTFNSNILVNGISIGAGEATPTGDNTVIGKEAAPLISNSNASYTIIGYQAGKVLSSGTLNTFIGRTSGFSQQTGDRNTFLGVSTGYHQNGTSDNTYVGHRAGTNFTTQNSNNSQCTTIGSLSRSISGSISNSTAIGYDAVIQKSNQMVFGNSSVAEFKTGSGYDLITTNNIFNYTLPISTVVNISASLQSQIDAISISGGSGSGNMLSELEEVAVTSASTLTSTAFGKMHNVSGTTSPYTVTLPSAVSNEGKIIGIRIDPSATVMITIAGSSSQTIDLSGSRMMWAGEVAIIKSNGSNWNKVAGKSLPMKARIYLGTDVSNFGPATLTKAALNTISYASIAGMCDTTNARLITLRGGSYNIACSMRLTRVTSSFTDPQFRVYRNGTSTGENIVIMNENRNGLAWISYTHSLPATVVANNGDYFETYALVQSYNANIVTGVDIFGAGNPPYITYMSIEENITW
jgi:hypothetical protein